ncbi:MAG: CBS domain-containing protein [Gammaproteobacteria bacterium]|nr:CBS domain-containing protein [Gammaproteobacteria bacterium]
MNDKTGICIRDVMKTDFDLIDGMDLVIDAIKKMKYVENKCLIVNKRHDTDEYGMLLLSDIARKVLAVDLSPERVNVYEIMAKPVLSVDPNMNIRYCARLFDRFDLSRAPVVENQKVIGVVSFTDLVMNGFFRDINFSK